MVYYSRKAYFPERLHNIPQLVLPHLQGTTVFDMQGLSF